MSLQVRRINLGFVNCYLIETAGGFILVDTGIRGARSKLEAALSRAGCMQGTLKLIVLTHGDIDHSGNGHYLRRKYGARIAMHKDDSHMVEAAEMMPNRIVRSGFVKAMHVVIGMLGGIERMTATFEKFAPDLYLTDGQSLADFGLDATVVHIPGHTPGSIGLLLGSGDFICGDTLQHGKPSMIIDNERELSSSIDKISRLNLKMVYPGHGGPFMWAS